MRKGDWASGRYDGVRSFIGELYGSDLHAKRVASLAGAALGVMTAASLAVAMIGHALARGLVTKHALKQVDHLLSNDGIDVWDSFARWVPHQIAGLQDYPGGDGLDRFRPRRPGDAGAGPGHRP
jgi:hypothetical protein